MWNHVFFVHLSTFVYTQSHSSTLDKIFIFFFRQTTHWRKVPMPRIFLAIQVTTTTKLSSSSVRSSTCLKRAPWITLEREKFPQLSTPTFYKIYRRYFYSLWKKGQPYCLIQREVHDPMVNVTQMILYDPRGMQNKWSRISVFTRLFRLGSKSL